MMDSQARELANRAEGLTRAARRLETLALVERWADGPAGGSAPDIRLEFRVTAPHQDEARAYLAGWLESNWGRLRAEALDAAAKEAAGIRQANGLPEPPAEGRKARGR